MDRGRQLCGRAGQRARPGPRPDAHLRGLGGRCTDQVCLRRFDHGAQFGQFVERRERRRVERPLLRGEAA